MVLGGGLELPASPSGNFSSLVPPQIDMQELPHGRVRSRSTVGEVREFGPPAATIELPGEASPATDADKIKLLEKALDRYRDAIAQLNQQLEKSETQSPRYGHTHRVAGAGAQATERAHREVRTCFEMRETSPTGCHWLRRLRQCRCCRVPKAAKASATRFSKHVLRDNSSPPASLTPPVAGT